MLKQQASNYWKLVVLLLKLRKVLCAIVICLIQFCLIEKQDELLNGFTRNLQYEHSNIYSNNSDCLDNVVVIWAFRTITWFQISYVQGWAVWHIELKIRVKNEGSNQVKCFICNEMGVHRMKNLCSWRNCIFYKLHLVEGSSKLIFHLQCVDLWVWTGFRSEIRVK